MGRRYRISKRMKRIQMRKARRTRLRRYGHYLSRRGINKVSKNLVKAREKLRAMRLGSLRFRR